MVGVTQLGIWGPGHMWGHHVATDDAPQQSSYSNHAHGKILKYSRKIQFGIDIDIFPAEKSYFLELLEKSTKNCQKQIVPQIALKLLERG